MLNSRIYVTILTIILITLTECSLPLRKEKETIGKVYIYNNYIPEFCSTSNIISQKKITLVKDEEELILNYKITFLVSFRDGISPILYGTLYYIDPNNQLHCMLLPNYKVAVFKNELLEDNKENVIQEICYPLNRCVIYDKKKFYGANSFSTP